MSASPTVSVIIPAFNAAPYLAEAIASALNQTHPPAEVVVVNDGSTDNTRDVVEPYMGRIRYIETDHAGVGAARNRGCACTTGEFISFLDADDLFDPRKLEAHLAAHALDPSLDMTFTHMRQFMQGQSDDTRAPQPGMLPGGAMIRRSAFARVGPFLEGVPLAEFIDWMVRAQDAGLNIVMLPDVLYLRRIHANNSGIREQSQRVQYVRVLKAALDRRRLQTRRHFA